MPDQTITGGCLCGSVRFEVKDRFLYAGYCHCSQCRRFSGAASTPLGGIATEDLKITSGADKLSKYVKSPATTLAFCSVCGSSLYAEKPLFKTLHVRFGSLDRAPKLLPAAHMYVSSAPSWAPIVDDLPQFDDLADPATRAKFMSQFSGIFAHMQLTLPEVDASDPSPSPPVRAEES